MEKFRAVVRANRRQRLSLLKLCCGSVSTYLGVLLCWLYCRGPSTLRPQSKAAAGGSRRTAPAEPNIAEASGLLCMPASAPRTLLVEVPFTHVDAAALELTVALWEQVWPCYRPPLRPTRPDLVLAFNGNLSEPAHGPLRARLSALLERRVIRECFGTASVESACLSGDADTYDKRRLNANWTVGPNNLFFHFRDVAVARGYQYMAQLEPDVLPLRPLWLEQMVCLAAHSSAWVVGSPFLPQCAHDVPAKRCTSLGDEIKFHLNGNALYAVGDPAFRAYYERAFDGQLSLWPFDLALHMYAATLPPTAQRRLASKFRAHPFIMNYGAEPLSAAVALAVAMAAGGGPSTSVAATASTTSTSTASSNSSSSSSAAAAAAAGAGAASASAASSSASATAATASASSAMALLRATSKATYLVHSSWAMALLRRRGASGFVELGLPHPANLATIAELGAPSGLPSEPVGADSISRLSHLEPHATSNGLPTMSGAHNAPHEGGGPLPGYVLSQGLAQEMPESVAESVPRVQAESASELAVPGLLQMAARVVDREGRLLLTFATAVYDPLCRNFVAHARRLQLSNYLLVTFTRTYFELLVRRGEKPYLHELPSLTSDGSDVFASRDFFTINAARYTVLTQLLRAGVNVFSLDLDVVLLRDPLPHVWSLPYDLLLQSDARDASTLVETSPFLLRDRLHLPNTSTRVTYVNGGVFFARGTHAVARVFEDTWALTSQDLGRLNEQDCLNRMLLASSLRWAPLSPRLFPNGFVYFRRPVQPEATALKATHPSAAFAPFHAGAEVGVGPGTLGPMLLHCNWINGIPAKRYLLREARVWIEDEANAVSSHHGVASATGLASAARSSSASATSGTSRSGQGVPPRYLAYSVSEGERSLGGQERALRMALALAHITNRTLVLPSLYILPPQSRSTEATAGSAATSRSAAMAAMAATAAAEATARRGDVLAQVAAQEARSAFKEGRRTLTYLFEYAPLLHHFPEHRESSLLRTAGGGDALTPLEPEELPSALSDIGDGDTGGDSSDSNAASSEMRLWLSARRDQALLHVRGLPHVPMRAVFPDRLKRNRFERRLTDALQPAPELRVISQHIVSTISAHVHWLANLAQQSRSSTRSHGEGGREGGGEGGGGEGGGESGGEGGGGEDGGERAREPAGRGGRKKRELPATFNCLHVTAAELTSVNRLRAAAAQLPRGVPTILVQEVGMTAARSEGRAADNGAEGVLEEGASADNTRRRRSTSHVGWLTAIPSADGVRGNESGSDSKLLWAISQVFSTPLRVSDFYPYWDAVEVDDGTGGHTLAYDLVQQLVCSAARRIHGDAGHHFVHGVCHWRRNLHLSKQLGSKQRDTSTAYEDVCSNLWDL